MSHDGDGAFYKGVFIVFSLLGMVAVTSCAGKQDAQNVSREEARTFLNTQTDFETYTLGEDVLCYDTKYDTGWGVLFTGTRADQTTFKGIVCAKAVFVSEGPNQDDDPLDVRSNQQSHVMFPKTAYYRVALPD